MYNTQFTQILETDDIYAGDPNHADLRFLYKNIIDSIKRRNVYENGTEYPVQLTNVDEAYVKSQVEGYLEDEDVGEYSKEHIINTLVSNTARINQSIAKDINLILESYKAIGREPVFSMTLVSIEDLRKKNLVD